MSLADELQKLQQLREAGALTDAEFELAKQKLLQTPAQTAPPPQVVVPKISLLREVDPDFTRVADKAVNFRIVTSVIGSIVGLIMISIVAFGACTTFGHENDSPGPSCNPNRTICQYP